jgi:hypothetical protein
VLLLEDEVEDWLEERCVDELEDETEDDTDTVVGGAGAARILSRTIIEVEKLPTARSATRLSTTGICRLLFAPKLLQSVRDTFSALPVNLQADVILPVWGNIRSSSP